MTDLSEDLAAIESATVDGYDEAAVREEILTPLLKALGYIRGDSPTRIAEPKPLKRVMVGSKAKKLSTTPDYVLEVDGDPAAVVEAKAPVVAVDDAACEQAGWYAVDSRVNARFVFVSNGSAFVVLRAGPHPSEPSELLRFARVDLRTTWPRLVALLGPGAIRRSRLVDAGELAARSLPGSGSIAATFHLAQGQDASIVMHPAPGGVFEGQFSPKTSGASEKLRQLAQGGVTGSLNFAPGELDVLVGGTNIAEHFDAPVGVEIVRRAPDPITVAIVTARTFRSLRVTCRPKVDPAAQTVEIGAPDRGVWLRLGPQRADLAVSVTGEHVMIALRIIEFATALAKDGELLVLDDATDRLLAAGRLQMPPLDGDAFLVPALRAASYVALRLNLDIRFSGELTEDDARNAATLAMMLRGEDVPTSVTLTVPPESAAALAKVDRFWPQGWTASVFGTPVSPGSVAFIIDDRAPPEDVGAGVVRLSFRGRLRLETPPAAASVGERGEIS